MQLASTIEFRKAVHYTAFLLGLKVDKTWTNWCGQLDIRTVGIKLHGSKPDCLTMLVEKVLNHQGLTAYTRTGKHKPDYLRGTCKFTHTVKVL